MKRLVVIVISLNLLLIGAAGFLVTRHPGTTESPASSTQAAYNGPSAWHAPDLSGNGVGQSAASDSELAATASGGSSNRPADPRAAAYSAQAILNGWPSQHSGQSLAMQRNDPAGQPYTPQSGAAGNSSTAAAGGQSTDSSPAGQALAQTLGQSKSAQTSQGDPTVKMPMALLVPDPSLNFGDQQQQQLDNLAQKFIDSVGGLSQNPTDPAYRQQWISAQELSDQEYEATFGIDAFNKEQFLQSQQAMNPSTPSK